MFFQKMFTAAIRSKSQISVLDDFLVLAAKAMDTVVKTMFLTSWPKAWDLSGKMNPTQGFLQREYQWVSWSMLLTFFASDSLQLVGPDCGE